MERDPVCGMSVAPEKAAATVEFEGKRYFFCAKSCAAKFEKEPAKYLSAKMPEGMDRMGHSGGLLSIGAVKGVGGESAETQGAHTIYGEKSPPRSLSAVRDKKAASTTASKTGGLKSRPYTWKGRARPGVTALCQPTKARWR